MTAPISQTTALKQCMENAGVDCEASQEALDISKMIPTGQETKIIAAALLLAACNPLPAPSGSEDPGSDGQTTIGGNYFYFHNGTEWLRVLGTSF
jgi:hypothetical protein